MKKWDVLKDKEIIKLMIGASAVKHNFIDYMMPHMSAQDICEFGNIIGMTLNYSNVNKLSRVAYMQEVIDYVIAKDKVNLFWEKLLDVKRFKSVSIINEYKSPIEIYWLIVSELMLKINGLLFFEGCHIEYNFDTWQFNLIDNEGDIKIESNNIDRIDNYYIKRLNSEIDNLIKSEDYESVITKSRTLLEEVMFHGIEIKNEEALARGDITKLYRKFKTLYNMHQNPEMDKRINNLLSGFEKIITSISEMRDANSDSHGVGKKRINIEKHHATLFKNASVTMAEFLLSVIDNKS